MKGIPRGFLFAIGAILLSFSVPLYAWIRFALQSDLYSYVLLVPIVSVYLFVSGLKGYGATPLNVSSRQRWAGIALALVGLGVVGVYTFARFDGVVFVPQDSTAITTFAFVAVVAAAALLFLNRPLLRIAAFPLFFLAFMAPFPVAMEHAIEMFLQHGSAPPSYWFFKLAGTPVYRDELIFQLPGMTLQIAPECSGIRSTTLSHELGREPSLPEVDLEEGVAGGIRSSARANP